MPFHKFRVVFGWQFSGIGSISSKTKSLGIDVMHDIAYYMLPVRYISLVDTCECQKGMRYMPPLYKEAVCWLVLLVVTALAYGVLMIFLGPIRAMGTFGLFGLAGLQPLLYRKQGKKVVWDERDTRIHCYANNVGFGAVSLVFTLAPMSVWSVVYLYEGRSMISVHVLPNLLMIGFIMVITARAATIVFQYRLQDTDKGE